jgi:hypothetical protein
LTIAIKLLAYLFEDNTNLGGFTEQLDEIHDDLICGRLLSTSERQQYIKAKMLVLMSFNKKHRSMAEVLARLQ